MQHRINALDYLRGLLAVSVMIYHYTAWSSGSLPVESVLGRLGVYSVATFFVLSGLSLGIVYRIKTGSDIVAFAVKRYFRLAPLFWLVATIAILIQPASLRTALLNYSLLFGFVDPHMGVSTGAWSIGNEMLFYALFPAIVLSPRLWLIGSLVIGAWFAFAELDPHQTLSAQWRTYVEPMNNLFLFAAGVAMARSDAMRWRPSLLAWTLVMTVTAFCLYPMQGNSIVQVTGVNRFVMAGICVAFVFALYRLAPEFRGWLAKSLAFLGRGSYSIYLTHPLVLLVFVPDRHNGPPIGYASAAVCTLLLSALTYRFLEVPAMRLGRAFSPTPPTNRLTIGSARATPQSTT